MSYAYTKEQTAASANTAFDAGMEQHGAQDDVMREMQEYINWTDDEPAPEADVPMDSNSPWSYDQPLVADNYPPLPEDFAGPENAYPWTSTVEGSDDINAGLTGLGHDDVNFDEGHAVDPRPVAPYWLASPPLTVAPSDLFYGSNGGLNGPFGYAPLPDAMMAPGNVGGVDFAPLPSSSHTTDSLLDGTAQTSGTPLTLPGAADYWSDATSTHPGATASSSLPLPGPPNHDPLPPNHDEDALEDIPEWMILERIASRKKGPGRPSKGRLSRKEALECRVELGLIEPRKRNHPAEGGEGAEAGPPAKRAKPANKRPKSPEPELDRASLTAAQLSRPEESMTQIVDRVLTLAGDAGLSLRQVYHRIEVLYPYFHVSEKKTGWRSTVRHKLASNTAFKKVVEQDIWVRVPGVDLEQGRIKPAKDGGAGT